MNIAYQVYAAYLRVVTKPVALENSRHLAELHHRLKLDTYKIHPLDVLRAEFGATSRSTEHRLCDGKDAATASSMASCLRELRKHALDITMTESLVYEPSQRFRYKQKTIRCQYCLGKRNLGSLQHQTRRFRWGVRPVKR